jgi:hypothetical protein
VSKADRFWVESPEDILSLTYWRRPNSGPRRNNLTPYSRRRSRPAYSYIDHMLAELGSWTAPGVNRQTSPNMPEAPTAPLPYPPNIQKSPALSFQVPARYRWPGRFVDEGTSITP